MINTEEVEDEADLPSDDGSCPVWHTKDASTRNVTLVGDGYTVCAADPSAQTSAKNVRYKDFEGSSLQDAVLNLSSIVQTQETMSLVPTKLAAAWAYIQHKQEQVARTTSEADQSVVNYKKRCPLSELRRHGQPDNNHRRVPTYNHEIRMHSQSSGEQRVPLLENGRMLDARSLDCRTSLTPAKHGLKRFHDYCTTEMNRPRKKEMPMRHPTITRSMQVSTKSAGHVDQQQR